MKEKKMKTLLELIKANKSFSCALKDELYPEDNSYITFEMVLIFLKANMNVLKSYDIDIYKFIKELLSDKNYYIEGDIIYTYEGEYYLNYFVNLVYILEEYKHQEIPIPFYAFSAKDGVTSKKSCKFYSFQEYLKISQYEMTQKDLVFQYTLRVDKSTRPYINMINDRFEKFISLSVFNYLSGHKDKISINELKVIAAYINLIPLFFYSDEEIDFHLEKLHIPSNEIGLAKITFDDEEVIKINRKIKTINEKKQQLEQNEKLIVDNDFANYTTLAKLRRRILRLEQEESMLLFKLYETTNLAHVYNPTLLKAIWQSFWDNTVDINTFFDNPVLKLFSIKDNVTRFYSAMHLDTLFKLIDNDTILKSLNDEQKLLLTS